MLIMPNIGPKSWADAKATTRDTEALVGLEPLISADWDGWRNGFPLARQFFASFQGMETEAVRLWRMVRSLAVVPNLADLVAHDLGGKAWSHYYAAVMALEFCSRWRAAGCDVELVARDQTKGQTPRKTPDARVKLVGRWTTVEFKALHDHDDLMPWYEDFEPALGSALLSRSVGGTAFDRELTPAARTDVEAVADGLVEIAKTQAHEWMELPRGTGKARLAQTNLGVCGYPVSAEAGPRTTSPRGFAPAGENNSFVKRDRRCSWSVRRHVFHTPRRP